MARLILEIGGEKREIKVTGSAIAGRSPEAAIRLDEKTLSREHTRFYHENNRLYVRDLGSKNGTYLNGALLRGPEALSPGDRVKIGAAVLTVADAGVLPAAAPPPTPAPAAAPAAPSAPARARLRAPREREAQGPGGIAVLGYRLILAGVVVGGAFVSKTFIFSWLLPLLLK